MSERFAGVPPPFVALAASLYAALALGFAVVPAAHGAPAQVAYALSQTNLLSFDPATPQTVQSTPITNVIGQTLVGIDVRPQNGMLYALGVNAAANTATLYVVGRTTGFASVVGPAPNAVAFVQFDGSTPVDLPDPATVGYGFDVNPAADRIRVVAGTLSFRVNPNTGLGVDSDGAVAGTNPDGTINGATTTVDAAAYTNSRPNNGNITTLYTLDAATDSLFIQSPPNAGTQIGGQAVTLGPSSLNFTAISGFDIDPSVNAPASNAAVTSGSGYAALNPGGATGLYSINLVDGAATSLGTIGNGTSAVHGLALQRDFDDAGFPVVSLDTSGTNIVRFSSATPGTTTTQAINLLPVPAGEMLVGVALRPQTGQYYTLGVNAAANTATLYVLDPQAGTVSAAGASGSVAWVQADGTTLVDLPDPATAAWGLDFNPAVDRLRVVTSTGLNGRVNPNAGAAIDGDPGVPGVNPDAPINGSGVTGVSATSYTNAFAQPLAGGVTTQYTIDAATDALYIQNPSNAGTQTLSLPLTLGGAAVNISTLAGLDIPGDVAVSTSNTPAKGEAIAALTVAGSTGIYRLDLATGKLVLLGVTISNLRSIAVGDAQRDLPVLARAPAALAFGGQDVDSGPSTLTSTVTNPGSTTVELTAIALGGADAAEFQVLTGGPADCATGTVLTTGQTCDVRVRFDPATTGAKAASVTVASTAPGVAIALSGTGTTAVVVPPPALLGPVVVAPGPAVARVAQFATPRLLGKSLGTGVAVACPAASPKRCTGSVRVRRRSIRSGATATVLVGRAAFSAAPGATQVLRVRPKLAVRRLMRRVAGLSLSITVLIDQPQGGQRTSRFTATIARQPG